MKFIKSRHIFENVNQAKSILKKNGKDTSDDAYKHIRDILKKANGYVGWFTNLHYNHEYSLNDLLELYNILETEKVYLNRLSNPVIKYDNIEKLQDEIENIKNDSIINKVINEFPNKQRKFLKKEDSSLLLNLGKRKDIKNFLKKVSSYHRRPEMISAIKDFLSVDPNSGMNTILKKAETNGSKIVYKSYDDQILIIEVNDVDQLNSVAGDCSWCIRSRGTFDSYTRDDNRQYIIFLFDRIDNLSKIGVTSSLNSNNFLKAAHDKSDRGIGYGKLKEILNEYNFNVDDILKYTIDNINIDSTSVKKLINNFKLPKEEIVKLKNRYTKNDIELFDKDEIEKWNLIDKSELTLKILLKYSFDEVVSRKMVERLNSLSISDIMLMYDKYGYDVIQYLKDNQDIMKNVSGSVFRNNIDDKDFFYNDVLDGEITKNLKVGNTWSDTERYSYDRSMFKILWNKDEVIGKIKDGEISIDDLFIDNYDLSHIVPLMKKGGITVHEYYDKMLNKIGRENVIKLVKNLIEWCNEENIDYTEMLDEYVNNVLLHRSSDTEIKRYAESGLFTEEQIKSMLYENKKRSLFKDIPRVLYDRNVTKSYAEKFYDKWNEDISEFMTWNSDTMSLIILYAKLGKLDELQPFKLKGYGGQRILEKLSEILTDTFKTNGGMDEPLSDEEKMAIYNFFKKCDVSDLSLSGYQTDEGTFYERSQENEYYYLPIMFIYDKDNFYKYLEENVKNVRYNELKDDYFVPDRGNKEKNKTNRISEVGSMFRFLGSLNDADETFNFIKAVLNMNINFLEFKSLIEMLGYYLKGKLNSETVDMLQNYLRSKTKSERLIDNYRLKLHSLLKK